MGYRLRELGETNVRYEMKTTGCTMLVSMLRGVSAPHTRVTDVTRKLSPPPPPPRNTHTATAISSFLINPEITVLTDLSLICLGYIFTATRGDRGYQKKLRDTYY